MRSNPKRPAKPGKKESLSRQPQQHEKKVTGEGETPAPSPKIPRSESSHQKAAIDGLPDFSADWQMPAQTASTAEIEAHFYYEFARESETILGLTETLSLESEPLQSLFYLQYPCFAIANALMPKINLRETSWQQLESEQKKAVTSALSPQRPGPAFDSLNIAAAFSFARGVEQELIPYFDKSGELLMPTKSHYRLLLDPRQGFPSGIWNGPQLLDFQGRETIAIAIDWAQGPRAIKVAMKEWFDRHKRDLFRLKSRGKLPEESAIFRVYNNDHHRLLGFHLREETGAGTRSRKHLTALRRLGAMRLLGKYSFAEAVTITHDVMSYPLFSGHRSAWNAAVKEARRTFRKLFYSRDQASLRIRRTYGLPVVEEPISYQRYRRRTKNK